MESVECVQFDQFAVLVLRAANGQEGLATCPVKDAPGAEIADLLTGIKLSGSDAGVLGGVVGRMHGLRRKLWPDALNRMAAWMELALLDLVAKSEDLPVVDFLGGAKRRVIPIYYSSSARKKDPLEELEAIQGQLETTGIRAVKVKVGRGKQHGDDVEPLRRRPERFIPLARRLLGDEVVIYADANGTYSPARALEVAYVLADYGVRWFEEPVPHHSVAALRELARQSPVPLACGEHFVDRREFDQVIRMRACSVVQPDLWLAGGLRSAMAIAGTANRQGLPTVLHHPRGPLGLVYSMNFAAVINNPGSFQEYREGMEDSSRWFARRLHIAEGEVQMPKGAGFGTIDDSAHILRDARAGVRARTIRRIRDRIVLYVRRAAFVGRTSKQ